MNLTKQIHTYSLDTACFYTEAEMAIHRKLLRLYIIRSRLEKPQNTKRNYQYHHKKVNKYIKTLKEQLEQEFIKTRDYNSNNHTMRQLRPETLIDKNVVSIFESFLTRTLKIKTNELTTDIMIVQVYFFQVAEDLIKQGFVYNGERYVLFSASAGQIRTKKFVVIKESLLKKYEKTLMCGLDIETINAYGGVNPNKFLAYYALANSATEEWTDFDIDKSIVVDDFETEIECEVDFIDDITYTITRKIMPITIPHMDGAGLVLDDLTTMCRLPWIKGLLIHFDFRKFIREQWGDINCNCGLVKDIYGDEHDILKEDIKYIFTKSQFKMHKFYANWDEYKKHYKQYHCTAGKTNEEKDKIPNARINYQMLQTLTDISKREMERIAKPTLSEIGKIGNDYRTTMRLLGATDYNAEPNYMQKILQVYPELLRDRYNHTILKDTQRSLIKQAKSGRLRVDGKYTFVAPDVYAFCEWLFCEKEKPDGLLQNGEVSCNLYSDGVELDCLRSPHLSREHAVRRNVVNEKTQEWFDTKCVYTSVHDAISRILQFD